MEGATLHRRGKICNRFSNGTETRQQKKGMLIIADCAGDVSQTKAGLPYYDGNPYDFEQWHFVVMGKYDAYASKKDSEVREQDRIELSVKVIEGLKDDLLKCAMDLGRDVVVAPDGVLRIA